ncbi:DUF4932 domain-containing protein [Mucilaginibacter lacusdianchii]|uniref:DUF4932 domain-containing protein n=1 Tax=Mucilaginibacter lacusdianchii TaxID=2684211 RepID=UPI00131B8E7C|nr:DUF4932 domain-containing protein [Mucilaginibacter sp. JXJ CY 39]
MKALQNAIMGSALLLSAVSILSVGCKSYDIAPRYTSKHIKENTNQAIAQVPEAYELGYIVLSLTDAAQQNDNIINKETPYYQEVSKHFSAYKKHKAVRELNEELSEDANRLTYFRNGLYAFYFNSNRFVLKADYRIDLNRLDFKKYASLLKDFAKDSGFRQFYAQHKSFYNELIKSQQQQLSMESAWKSVEKTYDKPFQSYQVILSPLMKGETGTVAINSHRFNECLIFAQSGNRKNVSYGQYTVPVTDANGR